jgi:hypothetical protein
MAVEQGQTSEIAAAVAAATPGSFMEVEIPTN